MKLQCFYCEKKYDFGKDILFVIPLKGTQRCPNPNRPAPICYNCYGENVPEEQWSWAYKFRRFPKKYHIK